MSNDAAAQARRLILSIMKRAIGLNVRSLGVEAHAVLSLLPVLSSRSSHLFTPPMAAAVEILSGGIYAKALLGS